MIIEINNDNFLQLTVISREIGSTYDSSQQTALFTNGPIHLLVSLQFFKQKLIIIIISTKTFI